MYVTCERSGLYCRFFNSQREDLGQSVIRDLVGSIISVDLPFACGSVIDSKSSLQVGYRSIDFQPLSVPVVCFLHIFAALVQFQFVRFFLTKKKNREKQCVRMARTLYCMLWLLALSVAIGVIPGLHYISLHSTADQVKMC